MSLLERYANGEILQVYSDIHNLGQAAFSDPYFNDVQAVITETMRRAVYNLDIIHKELERMGYNFKRNASYSFEQALLKPFPNAENLLTALEKAVSPFHVPVSLKLFYVLVGSCNFAWDYETNERILWPGADPIQIATLNDLLDNVTGEDWTEEMAEYRQEHETAHLKLSADHYHKDNISGGPPMLSN